MRKDSNFENGNEIRKDGKTMNIQKKLMTVRNSLKSGKEAFNNFGKYAYRNAEQMLAGINPLLQKQGLTLDFTDDLMMLGNRTYVKTTLTVHDTEDGEAYSITSYAREPEQKKGMDESQITGSSITYCHKYALMSMFAISDPKMDPDSMDNSPEKQQATQQAQVQSQAQRQPQQAQRPAQAQQWACAPNPWETDPNYPVPPMPGTPRYVEQQTTLSDKGNYTYGYSPK